jgi:hypothetical protein
MERIVQGDGDNASDCFRPLRIPGFAQLPENPILGLLIDFELVLM